MDKALLIAHLRDRDALRTPVLIRCFERIDRRDFVTDEEKGAAYGDYPLPIGFGQTISQPYTVAFMLELLGAEEGNRVLDIGSGSGWTTALLACVVGRQGSVIGLERIDELVVRHHCPPITTVAVASATIPSSRPIKPILSLVVALTETRET